MLFSTSHATTMPEQVVLVDETDAEIGVGEKLQAHIEGSLHRALSVFVFNPAGELLLQQRHPSKYHSGGLWSNTCCSHPRPGEAVAAAAQRRLREEMGIACDLERLFGFVYRVRFSSGLFEHEYDHVCAGVFDGDTPQPDATEVMAWRWVSLGSLQADVATHPERYTYWFRLLLDRFDAFDVAALRQ